MRVLFDQGTPALLRHLFPGHEVATAYECGWSTLKNCELLASPESEGFMVLITTDTNLNYQQNLATRTIAIVVLETTSWPRIKAASEVIVAAVNATVRGSYAEVAVP